MCFRWCWCCSESPWQPHGKDGIALLWCARDVQHKRVYVNALAAAFLVGGIGRLLAILVDGQPNRFSLAMLVLELALPPLMVLAARRVASPS